VCRVYTYTALNTLSCVFVCACVYVHVRACVCVCVRHVLSRANALSVLCLSFFDSEMAHTHVCVKRVAHVQALYLCECTYTYICVHVHTCI